MCNAKTAQKSRQKHKNRFLGVIFALVFALTTLFVPTFSQIALADPSTRGKTITNNQNNNQNQNHNQNNNQNQNQNNNQSQNNQTNPEKSPETCAEAIDGIGWLVCPGTGFFAKAIDSIVSIIHDFLQVKPLAFDNNSPLHTVWRYFRDLTNIIFIILLIIVVYSHLTGIGLNNYNIKRIMPRIIVAAIMINLSFLICAIAVDISNILGVSLRGFFDSIAKFAAENSRFSDTAGLSWGEIAGILLTGVGIGTAFTIAAGGFTTVMFLFIPIALGALIAVIAGLITIAARQAVIWLLVMTAPLAFVAYLLPNTEQWFKKWRTIFTQMLFFYPAFSALFGAANLAGFAIIASSENVYNTLLGMAVQAFPLFYSVKLMKMSGTALEKLNPLAAKALSSSTKPINDWAKDRAAIAEQQYYNKGATATRFGYKGFKYRNAGAMLYSADKHRKLRRKGELESAISETETLAKEYMDSRKLGKKIIGYDGDRPIYKTQFVNRENPNYDPKTPGSQKYFRDRAPILTETAEFRREQKSRLLKSRAERSGLEVEKAFNSLSDYIEHEGIKLSKKHEAEINARLKANLATWEDTTALKSAIARNEAADRRFMHETIRNAAKTDENGNIADLAAYNRHIIRAAGYDALGKLKSTDNITDPALLKEIEIENQRINKLKNDALISVIGKSTEAFEAERAANVKMYGAYAKKNITRDVISLYKRFLDDKNIDGIVAVMQELNLRGDNDVIGKHLGEHMDQEGYLEIGTDFANTLASALMGLKKSDPFLGRLGKHINVETAHKTISGERKSSQITMKEFMTGVDSEGNATKGSALTYLAGTSYNDIDRTSLDDMEQFIELHLSGDEHAHEREQIYKSMLPQLVSALPTFQSGSDEIKSVIKYMTGIKKDKNGNWQPRKKDDFISAAEHTKKTKQYMNALTASNIINMKSDAIEAVLAKFAMNGRAQGMSKSAAENYAKQQYVDSFNQDVLRILANSPDVSTIKGKNFTLLEDRLNALKNNP